MAARPSGPAEPVVGDLALRVTRGHPGRHTLLHPRHHAVFLRTERHCHPVAPQTHASIPPFIHCKQTAAACAGRRVITVIPGWGVGCHRLDLSLISTLQAPFEVCVLFLRSYLSLTAVPQVSVAPISAEALCRLGRALHGVIYESHNSSSAPGLFPSCYPLPTCVCTKVARRAGGRT